MNKWTEQELEKAEAMAPDLGDVLGELNPALVDDWIDPETDEWRDRADDIMEIEIPPHRTEFDEDHFKRLVAEGMSLTWDEKERMLLAVPRMTQQQVDTLISLYEEGEERWNEFKNKHKMEI